MPSNIDFNELLRKIDIVQIVTAEGIQLIKKGKNYFGLCPFHDDKHPSMSVSPEKQIFRCFTCQTSGNAFTFVQQLEHLSFIQAVKRTCELAGITPVGLEDDYVLPNSKHQDLFDTLNETNTFYSYSLKVPSGANAMNYLKSRKLDDTIIDKFKIGYASNDSSLTINYLKGKGFDLDKIIYSGAGLQKDSEVYDRMSGRITFAIQDEYGRIIGFSGRRIDDSIEPKYLNTPETILFKKGTILYNYYNCEKACRKSGIVYLVEGFMDAIALSRAGIDNVVATMGTALTSEHANKLKKLNCEIHIMFDSDGPGQKAAFQSIEVLKNLPKGVRVVDKFNIDDCKDIDEVLDKYGKEKLLELIQKTSKTMDFRINYLFSRINKDNYEDRKSFVLQATKLLTDINDEMDLDHYSRMISELSNFPLNLINKYTPPKDNVIYDETFDYSTPLQKNHKTTKMINRFEKAERQIINELLLNKDAPYIYIQEGIFLNTNLYRRLASYIVDYYNINGDIKVSELLTNVTDKELINAIVEVSEEEYPPTNIKELFKIVKEDYAKDQEFKKYKDEVNETSDPLKQAQLAQKYLLEKQESAKKK